MVIQAAAVEDEDAPPSHSLTQWWDNNRLRKMKLWLA